MTITIDAEVLKAADGSPMPTTGLVILVASTNGVTFGGPTTNAFVSGDDLELSRWDLSAFASNGVLSSLTVDLPLSGGWQGGNPLQLYWYPTLTISATNHGNAIAYGQYRSASGADGSDPWITPALNSATISLKFFTAAASLLNSGGSNSAATGIASLTTPPETMAQFSASPTNGVAPLPVIFTDTSTGTITNRYWDFGNGTTTNTTGTILTNTYAAGSYTVTLIVSGPLGSGTNVQANAIVALHPPPVVTQAPQPTNVCAGTTATFSVTATGEGTLTYQWQTNTVNLSNGGAYSGATSNVLTIAPASAPAAANYRCLVSNDGGSATSTVAALTVTPVSVGGTATPAANPVCSGSGTSISLAGETGSIVKWQSSTNNVTWTDISSTTNQYSTGSLTVSTYFQAIVQNSPCSTTNSTAALVTVNPGVTPAVSIGANPGTTICSGTVVTFTAAPVNGGSTPTYVWKKNGSTVGGSTNTYTEAALADGDTVDCRLTSTASCAAPTTADAPSVTITVPTVPTVSATPTNLTVCAGLLASFSAAATGTPTIQWQVQPNGLGSWNTLSGASNTTYTFTASLANTGDLYRTVFSNACGSVTSTAATLTVQSGTLVVSPGNWDFGSVATGATVSTSFTVTNTGCGQLSGTATSAAPFAVVTGSPFTLPGFGATNLQVSFTPVTIGAFTDNVVFASDGGGATNQVTGQGAAAVVAVAQFSASPTNGSATLLVIFTDSSTGTITNRFWDFGDGTTSNTIATSLTHAYSLAGSNTVQLIVSGPLGVSSQTQTNAVIVTAYPPGDVNGDGRVTAADSLLINQVVAGLRTSNSVVFAIAGYANGDVNQISGATGADSLLINQVGAGLRAYLVTKIVPGLRTNSLPTAVTIYGVGFPTNTVTAITIGPPVNLVLSNLVVIGRERINAVVPAGGGIGTGTVSVTASPSNGITSFGRFINQ